MATSKQSKKIEQEENATSRLLCALRSADPSMAGELLVQMEEGKAPLVFGKLYTVLTGDELDAIVVNTLPEHGGTLLTAVEILGKQAPLNIASYHVRERETTMREEIIQEDGTVEEELQHTIVQDFTGEEAASSIEADRTLDVVKVLYRGEVPLGMVRPNRQYKQVNDRTLKKLELCYGVLGFMPPIIVDKYYRIIDGDLRYQVALKFAKRDRSRGQTIQIIVLDDAGVRTDFLRLALNRLSEFQRWIYPELDAYVDSTPQAQPLLEPLGFFGERMLPASYFGDTVVNYSIDQYNTQQQAYKQEMGLAEWAEIQRARLGREAASQKPTKKDKQEDYSKRVETEGLF